jgi:hypothetical protein
MERVTEAYEAANLKLVGDHAGHAPAHGLAADDALAAAAELCDGLAPGVEEDSLPVRGAALAVCSTGGHVGELEADDAEAPLSKALREDGHEGAVHRGAGAVRENEERCSLGAVEEEVHR